MAIIVIAWREKDGSWYQRGFRSYMQAANFYYTKRWQVLVEAYVHKGHKAYQRFWFDTEGQMNAKWYLCEDGIVHGMDIPDPYHAPIYRKGDTFKTLCHINATIVEKIRPTDDSNDDCEKCLDNL